MLKVKIFCKGKATVNVNSCGPQFKTLLARSIAEAIFSGL